MLICQKMVQHLVPPLAQMLSKFDQSPPFSTRWKGVLYLMNHEQMSDAEKQRRENKLLNTPKEGE